MPSWSDKLLQEVLRLILSAYYEPQFSSHSHGFRPDRGCHTALSESYHQWVGTTYFVEGDIAACFDALDHTVMRKVLRENIQDGRFLRLIETLLAAGYLEDWRYHQTLSGCPQGSILSPVLANVYLHKLDTFVETVLMPQDNKGERRQLNTAYTRVQGEAQRRRRAGQWKEAKALRKRHQPLPCYDTTDPDYRRLRYLRYADDILFGLAGPHSEAVEIKRQLGDFLQGSLKLTLSQEKTVITHARTQAARFLGYNIGVLPNDRKRDRGGHRSIKGQIGLKVPVESVKTQCTLYQKNGKPVQRKERTNDTVYSIISQYQQEFRGLAEYYQLAVNRYQLNRLKWVMERSLVATLAHKLRISISKVYNRYETTIETPDGPRKVLQVTVEREGGKKPLIARWGGITLARRNKAILDDSIPPVGGGRSELEKRLLADICALCGSREHGEVHPIRARKDLQRKGQGERPRWVQIMAARRRKTLVACRKCHHDIHAGRAEGRRKRE